MKDWEQEKIRIGCIMNGIFCCRASRQQFAKSLVGTEYRKFYERLEAEEGKDWLHYEWNL